MPGIPMSVAAGAPGRSVRARRALATILAIGAIALGWGAPVHAANLGCDYGEVGGSFAHALQGFQSGELPCAAQELHAWLTRENLSRSDRAEGHMLLAAVQFRLYGDTQVRDRLVREELREAYRALPSWRGEPYESSAYFRALMVEARRDILAEEGTDVSARDAGAIRRPRWEIGMGFGAAIPGGGFGTEADPGIAVALQVGYCLSRRLVAGFVFEPRGMDAAEYLERDARQLTGDPGAGMRWTTTGLGAFGKLLLSDGSPAPFVRLQAGWQERRSVVEAVGFESTRVESGLGLAGGGGLQFRSRRWLGGYLEAVLQRVPDGSSGALLVDVRGGLLVSVER